MEAIVVHQIKLEELELCGMPVLSFHKNCPSLKIVKISGVFIVNSILDLSSLNNSSTLTTLVLDSFLRSVTVTFPTNCKKLSKLHIRRLIFNNLREFDESPELRELILEIPYDPENRDKLYIAINCPSLETIELIWCYNVKDLSSLDGFQTLRRLVFADQIPNIRLPLNCPHLKIEVKKA